MSFNFTKHHSTFTAQSVALNIELSQRSLKLLTTSDALHTVYIGHGMYINIDTYILVCPN